MSKITWLNPCDSNAGRCPQSAPLSGRQDQVSARPAWTVTATAKRRRREAGLDKRLRARVREKKPAGREKHVPRPNLEEKVTRARLRFAFLPDALRGTAVNRLIKTVAWKTTDPPTTTYPGANLVAGGAAFLAPQRSPSFRPTRDPEALMAAARRGESRNGRRSSRSTTRRHFQAHSLTDPSTAAGLGASGSAGRRHFASSKQRQDDLRRACPGWARRSRATSLYSADPRGSKP